MHYVRRLLLQGLHNARDLGGYAVEGGGVTRYGVFIRSEAPCSLEKTDIEALLAYGLGASLDLRSSGEVRSRPSSLQNIVPYYHRSLFNEAVAFAPEDGEDDRKPSAAPGGPGGPPGGPDGPEHDWGKMYVSMAEEARGWAIDVLDIAAKADGALLYHCTTGKDRTGLLSCYLLSIAGAAAPDIVTNYSVSQVYLQPVYQTLFTGGMLQFGNNPDAPFFQTPPAAMQSLLDYLNRQYGGVVPFLQEIGVPKETMQRIREKFVEP